MKSETNYTLSNSNFSQFNNELNRTYQKYGMFLHEDYTGNNESSLSPKAASSISEKAFRSNSFLRNLRNNSTNQELSSLQNSSKYINTTIKKVNDKVTDNNETNSITTSTASDCTELNNTLAHDNSEKCQTPIVSKSNNTLPNSGKTNNTKKVNHTKSWTSVTFQNYQKVLLENLSEILIFVFVIFLVIFGIYCYLKFKKNRNSPFLLENEQEEGRSGSSKRGGGSKKLKRREKSIDLELESQNSKVGNILSVRNSMSYKENVDKSIDSVDLSKFNVFK